MAKLKEKYLNNIELTDEEIEEMNQEDIAYRKEALE